LAFLISSADKQTNRQPRLNALPHAGGYTAGVGNYTEKQTYSIFKTIGAGAIYPGWARAPPCTFPSWGQEEHRVKTHVNAQRYKLVALFVKNSHNIAL